MVTFDFTLAALCFRIAELPAAPEGPEAMEIGEPEPTDAAAAAAADAAEASGGAADAAAADGGASGSSAPPDARPRAASWQSVEPAAPGAEDPSHPAAAAQVERPAAGGKASAGRQLMAQQPAGKDAAGAADVLSVCCAVARCAGRLWCMDKNHLWHAVHS